MNQAAACPDEPGRLRHPGESVADRRRATALSASLTRYVLDDILPAWERVPDSIGCDSSPTRSQSSLEDAHSALLNASRTAAVLALAADADPGERRRNLCVHARSRLLQCLEVVHPPAIVSSSPPRSSLPMALRLQAASVLAMSGRVVHETALTRRSEALLEEPWEWYGASDWRPAAVEAAAEDGDERVRSGTLLEMRLCRLDAHLAVVRATGSTVWRKRCTDLATILIARSFDADSGLLFAGPHPIEPEHPLDELESTLNLEASSILAVAAHVLEEPGLADIAGRLLSSAAIVRGTTKALEHGDKPSIRRANAGAGPQAGRPRLTAAALRAFAHQYERRPSAWLLDIVEKVWRQSAVLENEGEPDWPAEQRPASGPALTGAFAPLEIVRGCLEAAEAIHRRSPRVMTPAPPMSPGSERPASGPKAPNRDG